MKYRLWAAVPAAVFLACPASAVHGAVNPSTIPVAPGGVISAYPSVVQTGTKPTLTWDIIYPSKVSDVASIVPPGRLSLTQNNIYLSVQPVGTQVTECSSGQSGTIYTDARISVNGGAYQQLFYGTQNDVKPERSLYTKKLGANTTVDFGGRFDKGGSWSPFYTSQSSNFQVVALVDGDSVPAKLPNVNSAKIASYLKPYISSTGKVNIGPMSVLLMMELGSTDRNSPCFDMQDQVLLITLSTKHPNNGHGNNLDGVDSSNPGQGKGGPNGAVDPSGGVDDERK